MKSIYAILFIFLCSGYAFAQPSNDACAAATALTITRSCSSIVGDNTSATASGETPTPTCSSFGSGEDVWYSFVAPTDGDIEIETTAGTQTDWALSLYSGSCGSLTEVECDDDDGPGLMPFISRTDLIGGNTYYIRVWEYANNATGTFNICVNDISPPANDAICSATALSVNGGCTEGDNISATTSSDPTASCYTTSHTVWYKFTATDDSSSVSTDFSGSGLDLSDTEIAVYSSSDNTCSGTLTEIGCNDDGGTGCANCSVLDFTTLTVGNTYFIMVDGEASTTGVFCVSVYETQPPRNVYGSTCALAHQMYSHSGCWVATSFGNNGKEDNITGNGNSESFNQSCSAEDDSSQDAYWAKFTATDATTNIDPIDFTGPSTADFHTISLMTGTCGSLTEAVCNSHGSKTNSIAYATTVGTEYYILITTGANYSGDNVGISICGTTACSAPSNNDCTSATAVTSGISYNITNACATSDKALCSGSTENNIWMSWTAPSDWKTDSAAFVTLANQDCYDNENADGGTQLSIYNSDETCGTITGGSSECIVYNNPNNQENFYANFIPVANSTYIINMDGYNGDGCTWTFQLNDKAPIIVALPVELTSFHVNLLDDNTARIDWRTASETNHDFFVLQKSKDGVYFKDFMSIAGQGTTSEKTYYEVIDLDPYQGVGYYRLKHVDFDGQQTYSIIIVLRTSITMDSFALFPNPVGHSKNVYADFSLGSDEDVIVKITDALGRTVLQSQYGGIKGANQISVDVSKLSIGSYLVAFETQSSGTIYRRLIKN